MAGLTVSPAREKRGNCKREGMTYTLWCEECGKEAAAYKGETGRNGFTRGQEHLTSLRAKDETTSALWLHSKFHHQEREDVGYSMRVTGDYSTPLDRQIIEIIQISNFKGPVLLNRKNELGGVQIERTQYRRWGSI